MTLLFHASYLFLVQRVFLVLGLEMCYHFVALSHGFKYCAFAVFIMVRKRRTELPRSGGESSESQETGAGRGAQPPAERSGPPQQGGGGGGYQGGRGPQSQQVGRGGGYGGGRGRGGMQQQHYGGAPEYQGRGRGQPQHGERGYGSGRSGGGRGGPPSGGPFRAPAPELHQATPAPYPAGMTPQPMPSEARSSMPMLSEASSSMQPLEPSPAAVSQQMQQLSIQQEGSSSQATQPPPASSKSMRFPLRPGKGSTGIRCIVKANHFFAELPDKDLHQYDVSD